MKGSLYLIPSPVSDGEINEVIPEGVICKILPLRVFVVEEIRSARRFLSKCGFKGRIDELLFLELNEHTAVSLIDSYINLLVGGKDVGLISEAGLPAVADPGALLVAAAHREGIRVIPLVGPSSLMLALMASGMNGQSFAFVGYLPVKPDERKSEIKRLEKLSDRTGQSQIIIETPYRNNALFSDLVQICSPSKLICVASAITSQEESIRTLTAYEWGKEKVDLNRKPCVFIL
ncbi:MAG: SAM-dependent methyltransferase [Rikenellaceae bacterium]|mgnify:FL=1|nr:SAM-dependent methyltransferase [Bacteroidales bacterium]